VPLASPVAAWYAASPDAAAQKLAYQTGAKWAGPSDQPAPVSLDAALIFAPVGALVPLALRAVDKGGIAVCGGIHMSDIPAMPYSLLWGERRVCSVANLTRGDGIALMRIAACIPLRTHTTAYPLEQANAALSALRDGRFAGAAVLTVSHDVRP